MEERRYVVEISRPLGSDLVAAASDAIAARLEMEAERIRTLLSGRVGAVTRPVLHEKALVIARVFGEAGVSVTVREVILEADPAGQAAVIVEEPPVEPPTESPSEPVPEPLPTPPSEPPAPDSTEHEPHGSTARPELDSIWDDDSGWDSEQEVVAPWNAPDVDEPSLAGEDEIDYRVFPSQAVAEDDAEDDAEVNGDLGADLDDASDDDSGDDLDSDPSAWAGGNADGGAASEPERGPPPQPWRKSPGESAQVSAPAGAPAEAPMSEARSGAAPAARVDEQASRSGESAAAATLPSTRWVPSPHDQIEPEPMAAGMRPFDEWEQPDGAVKATGETGRWWVPERAVAHEPVMPEPEGPPLRNYLIWALLASVVVLLGLQVLFALRDPAGRALDYQGGLEAYRQGDFNAARRAWEAASASGDARAQYMLGHMVQNGQGQPWSNARAAEWYRLAAEQGLPEAQVALADLYLRGLGVPPEPQTAAQWLAAAARSGNAEAQLAYGELLLHGQGVQQDFAQALAWFESAASVGSTRAVDLLDFVRAAGPLLLAQVVEPTDSAGE